MRLCLAVAGVKCKQTKTTCIFTCILLTGRASAFHLSLSHDFRLNKNECPWSAAALCSLFILVLVFRGGTKTLSKCFWFWTAKFLNVGPVIVQIWTDVFCAVNDRSTFAQHSVLIKCFATARTSHCHDILQFVESKGFSSVSQLHRADESHF